MKLPRLAFISALSFGFALAPGGLRAEDVPSTIKFSDPAKPGQVKVLIGRGDLRIRGADTPEVTVTSAAQAADKTPRKDGLRVLSAASSFSLTERENVVTLDALSDFTGSAADFQVTVPRNTSVVVQSSWGGDVTCVALEGDIEVNSLNGSVELDDVAGGVVVSTMNGEITANIRELRDNKPLSFASMNGEVLLRVPADAKATVRLRTQNGSVLTDFAESALVTKTESAPRSEQRSRSFRSGALPPEARQALQEAARLTVQVGHEVAAAVREGFEAAKEVERELERAERDRERAERDVERAERDIERAERDRNGRAVTVAPAAPPHATAPALPPMPPMPAIPTITGGKLVTGTLNGGGPEISVRTMNGDVILRQLKR